MLAWITVQPEFPLVYLSDKTVHFKIGREELSNGDVSAIEMLSKRVNLKSIDLMAITYAMGDGINAITPMKMVKDRGILSMEGAGKVTGGGTAVYDEIENSEIPTVIIPGIHKNTRVLILDLKRLILIMQALKK